MVSRTVCCAFVIALGCAAGPRARARLPGASRAPRAQLAPSAPLASRVERVLREFSRRGARPLAEQWVGFLREGARERFTVRASARGCLGFVGVGHRELGDLDLRVYNDDGVEVERDTRSDAHPYARVCLEAGGRVYVEAAATQGAGEVAVATVLDAPTVPPPLDDVLETRPRGLATGQRAPRGAVGRDPAVATSDELMQRALRGLASRGYARFDGVRTGRLMHQQSREERFRFEGGRCYVVLGTGGPHVDDLDLRVTSSDHRPLAQDVGLDASPRVPVCAEDSGEYVVEVRMYQGSGEWSLAAVEIPEDVAAGLGDDVKGIARARSLELAAEARSRAMTPVRAPLRAQGWLGLTQSAPLSLRAGHCYLVGVAPGEGIAEVDLWLSDARGAVLASDTGQRQRAALYHCATASGDATVSVRTPTARGDYVIQMFESREVTP